MKSAAKRIAAFNDRLLSSLIDPVLSAVQTQQAANFAAYATAFVPLQEQLHAILNGLGVLHIQWAAYEAYFGELYRIATHYSGDAAVLYTATLAAKYNDAAYGALVLDNLKMIHLTIFSIGVPVAPP